MRFTWRARSRRLVPPALTALLLAWTSPWSLAQAPEFEHAYGGLVHDAFTLDGYEYWTVEDGGRIRHCDDVTATTPVWEFQTTPDEVQAIVRRIFFLPGTVGARHGWAVGENGVVLYTDNDGDTWDIIHIQVDTGEPSGVDDLWDVHFLSETEGWILGLHAIWYTDDGGVTVGSGTGTWTEVTLMGIDEEDEPYVLDSSEREELELYAFDIAPGVEYEEYTEWTAQPDGYMLGLAAAEPGLMFRATEPLVWETIFKLNDHCTGLAACLCGEEAEAFEAWDVEISRHLTSKLALMVGGAANDCGMVFASTDDGLNWDPEFHECSNEGDVDCSCDQTYCNYDYNADPQDPDGSWHLRKYQALYGVSIFNGNNSAIAAGYKGQHIVRDPTEQLWRDRSDYSNDQVTALTAVTLPLFGGATGSADVALITGMGGYIRLTEDGGDTWESMNPKGDPWRIRDVFFFDGTDGWMVGQLFRLAWSDDAGSSWENAAPLPQWGAGFLQSLAFAGDEDHGVAVGDRYTATTSELPRILWTDNGGDLGSAVWQAPESVTVGDIGDNPVLRDVAWTGDTNDQEFWAVGSPGLIMNTKSSVGLDQWEQVTPVGIDWDAAIELEAVVFDGPSLGLIVGNYEGTAVAFQYSSSGGGTWYDVDVTDSENTEFRDAVILGSNAYAVGERTTMSGVEGVLLKSVKSGGVFGRFDPHRTVAACVIGDAAEPPQYSVLNKIALDTANNIWIAGTCGRVWKVTSTSLEPFKSQTDAHVLGMSFPAEDVGFLACHRASRTGHSIVRVQ